MIVDLPEPRDVEIKFGSGRSKNPIKEKFREFSSSLISAMRGEEEEPRRNSSSNRRDLDDTQSRLRDIPSNDSEFRANDRRVQIPQWLLLFLILQGGGIIWWAATMQSDLRYQEREKIRIEGKIDTLELQKDKLMEQMRENVKDEVSDEVTDQLLNKGIIRVQPSVP